MEIIVEKTGRCRGVKFTISRVAFGLGIYEPLLEFRESRGLMSPADIGHKVVDVMGTFIEEAIQQNIPGLQFHGPVSSDY